MNNIFRLNKDYIEQFKNNVLSRYKDKNIRSESSLFSSILHELDLLIRRIAGQLSSKRLIPKVSDYPDSVQFNNLITDIGIDLDSVYNAEEIIQNDITNLVNYNSRQREKVIGNIATTSSKILQISVKNNSDIVGSVRFPINNPFSDTNNLSTESVNVHIDSRRTTLTLNNEITPNKSVDVSGVRIQLVGKPFCEAYYPGSEYLGIGSHWKKSSSDPHFINQKSTSEVNEYKKLLIDTNENNSVGICEFELVRTLLYDTVPLYDDVSHSQDVSTNSQSSDVQTSSIVSTESKGLSSLRNHISLMTRIPETEVLIDSENSIQGKYVSSYNTKPKIDEDLSYKVTIPFNQEILTNNFTVEFSASDNGFYPRIDYLKSYIYSGNGEKHRLLSTTQDSGDGVYNCYISKFVTPQSAELIILYDNDNLIWQPFKFYMTRYSYSVTKQYLTSFGSNMTLTKVFHLFVDTEANKLDQLNRALNIVGGK